MCTNVQRLLYSRSIVYFRCFSFSLPCCWRSRLAFWALRMTSRSPSDPLVNDRKNKQQINYFTSSNSLDILRSQARTQVHLLRAAPRWRPRWRPRFGEGAELWVTCHLWLWRKVRKMHNFDQSEAEIAQPPPGPWSWIFSILKKSKSENSLFFTWCFFSSSFFPLLWLGLELGLVFGLGSLEIT